MKGRITSLVLSGEISLHFSFGLEHLLCIYGEKKYHEVNYCSNIFRDFKKVEINLFFVYNYKKLKNTFEKKIDFRETIYNSF